MSNLECRFLLQQVVVLESHCAINSDTCLVIDSLTAIQGALQVIPLIDLAFGLEDIVHDTEVDLLICLASLAREYHFVKAEDA